MINAMLSGFVEEPDCCRSNHYGSGRCLGRPFDPRQIELSVKDPDDALREEVINRKKKADCPTLKVRLLDPAYAFSSFDGPKEISIDQLGEDGSDFRRSLDEVSPDHFYDDCVCSYCMTKRDLDALPPGLNYEIRRVHEVKNIRGVWHQVFDILMGEEDARELGFSVT